MFGYFVFRDVPTWHTAVGSAIIVASGLYILYRERVHHDR
jgi:drug/metabolite transporter (DMT)-like permease